MSLATSILSHCSRHQALSTGLLKPVPTSLLSTPDHSRGYILETQSRADPVTGAFHPQPSPSSCPTTCPLCPPRLVRALLSSAAPCWPQAIRCSTRQAQDGLGAARQGPKLGSRKMHRYEQRQSLIAPSPKETYAF